MAKIWQDAPSLRELHAILPAGRYKPNTAIASVALAGLFALWLVAWIGALLAQGFALKLMLATLTGIFTGMLFVVGHDACHGALTDRVRFNRFAAWLAFLPSLHSPITWDWGHNRMHHSWTNLRTKDPGYAPLTLEEWRALPLPIERLRRFYFTLPGMGFYYLIEVWWRGLIWLNAEERAQLRSKRTFALEIASLIGFVALQIGLVAHFGAWHAQGAALIATEVALCVIWPFVVWNWVMAFVTIQHHTHPRVKWFDDEKRWSVFQSQVGGTVHMKFPRIIELAFANIFEHTAHHVDKRIPLYSLAESQRTLETHFGDTVIVQAGSIKHLRYVLKNCRLYDYQAQTWHDFDGRETG
jgi:acyl-lipid omega-6 desaturase (Delta-12 desaturase)